MSRRFPACFRDGCATPLNCGQRGQCVEHPMFDPEAEAPVPQAEALDAFTESFSTLQQDPAVND